MKIFPEYDMAVVSMQELFDVDTYSGHQARHWNPRIKRFISIERNGIYIIDLQQTLIYVNKTFEFVKETVTHDGNILFVDTKKQTQEAVQNEAERADMSYINHRWLGGMLTNFTTVSKRLARLKELRATDAVESGYEGRGKREILVLTRECTKLERTLGGIRDMSKVSFALRIVDIDKEYITVVEAKKLDIPVVTILDANCDPDDVDFPIPGNNDAIHVASVLTRIISTVVEEDQKAHAEHETNAAREAAGGAPVEPAAENTDQATEMDVGGPIVTEIASAG